MCMYLQENLAMKITCHLLTLLPSAALHTALAGFVRGYTPKHKDSEWLVTSRGFSLKERLVVKDTEQQCNGKSLLSGWNAAAPVISERGREAIVVRAAAKRKEESARETERANGEMCNCVFISREFPTFQDRTRNVQPAGKHLPPTTTFLGLFSGNWTMRRASGPWPAAGTKPAFWGGKPGAPPACVLAGSSAARGAGQGAPPGRVGAGRVGAGPAGGSGGPGRRSHGESPGREIKTPGLPASGQL